MPDSGVELCEAMDHDADLICTLPADHMGGHYDPDQGEWANGTNWCPIRVQRWRDNGMKDYFCIKPRNHFGVHVHPVVGEWPQDQKEPMVIGTAITGGKAGEVIEVALDKLGTCPGIQPPSDQDQRWAEYQAAREEVRKAQRKLKYARRKEQHAWEAYRGARTFTDPDAVTKP